MTHETGVSESAERAAALLERLLSDPAYRSEFRADPARACAEEGLPEVAAQLGRGRAMQTLEIRESRSSLAGVLMAAALEGASLAVLVDHAEAAGTVDPTAASALAQLTQNQPAVAPPPAVTDPTAVVDAGSPAAPSTRRPSPRHRRPSTWRPRGAPGRRPAGRRRRRHRSTEPAAGRRAGHPPSTSIGGTAVD